MLAPMWQAGPFTPITARESPMMQFVYHRAMTTQMLTTTQMLRMIWQDERTRASTLAETAGLHIPHSQADRGMYFIWDFTQLNVRPHSRVGLLKYKTAPKCSLSGPFRHSGVGRNPGAVGLVRSYNLNFTYPCQTLTREAPGISPSGSETAPANCRCTEAARNWDGGS